MASRIWQDVDGDWNNTANWSGGSVPTIGDVIIIASGSQNITTNLDQSAVYDITLRVGPGFTGDIGNASTPLYFLGTATNTSTAELNSGGDVYLKGEFDQIDVVGMAGSSSVVDLDGATEMDVATLNVLGGSGTVNIGGSASLATLNVINASSVTVDIAASLTLGPTTINMNAGTVTSASGGISTAWNIYGGTASITGAGAANAMNIYGNGTVNYNTTGVLTTLTQWAGTFTLANNTGSGVTITNSKIYGGTMNLGAGLATTVTLSTDTEFWGGTILPGANYDIGVAKS